MKVARRVIPGPGFVKSIKRFAIGNAQIPRAIETALRLLAEDAFDPRLKTHKLKGKLSGCWSATAAYDLRILFEFRKSSDGEEIVLLAVGTHDDVY